MWYKSLRDVAAKAGVVLAEAILEAFLDAYTGRKRLALSLAIGIVIALNVAIAVPEMVTRSARGYSDYQIFYIGSRLLASGQRHHLYDLHAQMQVRQQLFAHMREKPATLPYNHIPFEALIFLPFQAFPYATSFFIWTLANVGLMLLIAIILARNLRTAVPWYGILALEFAFFPIIVALMEGQVALLLLLFYVLAYRDLVHGHDFRAGCWIALGLMKFHLVVPFVLALALKRYWRFVAGFASAAVPLGLVSFLLIGRSGVADYLSLIRFMQDNPTANYVYADAMANLRGLVWAVVGLDATASPNATAAGMLVVLAALMFLLLVRAKSEPDRTSLSFDAYFSLAITFTVLVSYHANPHDVSILFLGIVIMLARAFSSEERLFVPVAVMLALFSFTPVCLAAFVSHKFFLFAIPTMAWAVLLARWTLKSISSRAELGDAVRQEAGVGHFQG